MAILDAKSSKVTALGNTYLFGSTIKESVAKSALATFADGGDKYPMLSLTGYINPVQNLNGQSAPYPAGGGKNKLPSPTSTTKTHNGITISVANGVYSINGTASATSEIIFDLPSDVAFDNTMKCAFLNDFANSNVVVYWRYNYTNGSSQGMNSTNYVQEYTSSNTFNKVRFLIASGTAISGTVHLSPVLIPKSETNPTAYIPYSNICPITGWTGMNVTRTGKNLYDWKINIYAYSAPITLNAGTYTLSAQSTLSNGNWYISGEKADGSFCTQAEMGLPTFAASSTTGVYYGVINEQNLTFTSPENGVTFRIGKLNSNGTIAAQLELGSTATTYEPYNGTTYPISWADEAGTVYGGYLDVVTGVLTVDRVIEEYDGTENWTKSGTYNGSFYLNTGTQHSVTNYPISSHATYDITFPAGYSFGQFGFDGTGMVNLNVWIAAAGTSKDDFKAYLAAQKTAGTPLQVVTYLATPQTYQLTPTEVLSVLGTNNVWCDTGEIEATYIADTKLYIDSKL